MPTCHIPTRYTNEILCGEHPRHYYTSPRFGDTTCIRCVGIVRRAATDAGLDDPCRPALTR